MSDADAIKRPEPGLVVAYSKNLPGTSYEHSLPHWALGLTLDGACEQGQPAGKRFRMEKGDFVVMRANTPQRWQALGKTKWYCIYCIFDPRPHWISWLNWEEIAPGFMKLTLRDLKVRREIRSGFFRAYRLGKSGLPDATDFVYNAIENVILSANRYYQLSGHSEYNPRVGKAMQYLAENLSAPLSLNKVAVHSNLSRAHLAYLFKKQVGIGPIAFQNQQRITRARQMLGMSFLSIKQIALELGFKTPNYFSACFRKVTGVNPRQYRRKRTSV
ncbi:MAG: helix-turn-helix domain-containing protein [Verrucomicrobiota bacterium]